MSEKLDSPLNHTFSTENSMQSSIKLDNLHKKDCNKHHPDDLRLKVLSKGKKHPYFQKPNFDLIDSPNQNSHNSLEFLDNHENSFDLHTKNENSFLSNLNTSSNKDPEGLFFVNNFDSSQTLDQNIENFEESNINSPLNIERNEDKTQVFQRKNQKKYLTSHFETFKEKKKEKRSFNLISLKSVKDKKKSLKKIQDCLKIIPKITCILKEVMKEQFSKGKILLFF